MKNLQTIGIQLSHEGILSPIHTLIEYLKAHYDPNSIFVNITGPKPPLETQSAYDIKIEKSRQFIADTVSPPSWWPKGEPWPPKACPPKVIWPKYNDPNIYVLHDLRKYEVKEFTVKNDAKTEILYILDETLPIEGTNNYKIIVLKKIYPGVILHNQPIEIEIILGNMVL